MNQASSSNTLIGIGPAARARILALAFCALVSAFSPVPGVASISTPVTVSGSVISDCTAVSSTVGGTANTTYQISNAYDPFTYPVGTPLKDSTPIVLSTNCTLGDTGGTAIKWTVGDGSNCGKGSTAGDRALVNGTKYLSYELYTDTSWGTQWSTNSCGTPGSTPQTSNGLLATNSISLYGLLPGGQNVPVGTYNDTLTVTLNF